MSARMPVTTTAVWTPFMNAAWLPSVTAALSCAGIALLTGATPIETASFASSSRVATDPGTPAPVSSSLSVEPTRLLMSETSTDVPSAPPICREVACRPPATPPSLTGALPTIASEDADITMPLPRPSATNGSHIVVYDESALHESMANAAPAWSTMPSGMDSRGPYFSVSLAPSGAATMETRLRGRVRTPDSTGE